MLKLFIISPAGKRYNISSITKDSISLSSNIDNIICEMEFELAYNYRDKLPFSPIEIEDGACFVELYEEYTLLFQGIIPKFQVQRENPKFNCYDPGFYINRNSDIFQFNKVECSQAIKQLLNTFEFPVGEIDTSKVTLDEYFYKETVGEVIKKIIDKIKEESGEKFYFYFRDNKFHFKKKNSEKYLSGSVKPKKFSILLNKKYVNIFNFIKDASYSGSFENMRNSIIVVDGDEKKMNKTDVAEDKTSIEKYGRLSFMAKQEKNDQKASGKNTKKESTSSKKDAKKDTKKNSDNSKKKPKIKEEIEAKKVKTPIKASNLLAEKNIIERTFSFACPGIPTMRAGELVEVPKNNSGISGIFEVKSVTHNFSMQMTLYGKSVYFMTLNLEKVDELDE